MSSKEAKARPPLINEVERVASETPMEVESIAQGEPKTLRCKDPTQADLTNLGDSHRRVKAVAQKKRKAFASEEVPMKEAPKRMKRAEIGQYLSDMIDEANAMCADSTFPMPTHLESAGTPSSFEKAESPAPKVLHVSDGSEFERSN